MTDFGGFEPFKQHASVAMSGWLIHHLLAEICIYLFIGWIAMKLLSTSAILCVKLTETLNTIMIETSVAHSMFFLLYFYIQLCSFTLQTNTFGFYTQTDIKV